MAFFSKQRNIAILRIKEGFRNIRKPSFKQPAAPSLSERPKTTFVPEPRFKKPKSESLLPVVKKKNLASVVNDSKKEIATKKTSSKKSNSNNLKTEKNMWNMDIIKEKAKKYALPVIGGVVLLFLAYKAFGRRVTR